MACIMHFCLGPQEKKEEFRAAGNQAKKQAVRQAGVEREAPTTTSDVVAK